MELTGFCTELQFKLYDKRAVIFMTSIRIAF